MKESELKTYDIASYDIELDYNKQIDPIEKRIDKLNSTHESKSLKAHKDFLQKEKKANETINQLGEKSILKHQRIERAVENKLAKLQSKEDRYQRELEEFIAARTEEANAAKAEIDQIIADLKVEQQEQIAAIQLKYKENIESYVEKLDIYNNNYEQNKTRHFEQINAYQAQLNEQIATIQAFYDETVAMLDKRVAEFLADKEQSDKVIQERFEDTQRIQANMATTIRKQANVQINDANAYVDKLKQQFELHYAPKIERLEHRIAELQTAHEDRVKLIETDTAINLTKLQDQLAELDEQSNKKAKKNIEMKLALFELRAATTLEYEQKLLDEQKRVLEHEHAFLQEQLDYELTNLEKLRVFLLDDQNNLKETGDYFRDLNVVLRRELNRFELANNAYLFKHEQLKAEFIRQYTRIFSDLKRALVQLAQAYLEKIADNNHAIDEINKFLDTAEPLREIEVNRLRESIEINEVEERYNIKFAKQEYEQKLIDNDLALTIKEEELKTRELLSEYHKDVADIKNKEVFDKALEKAKLKHSKAQETYKLRLNNTKLERRLLKSKYDTEQGILLEQKQLAEIDVRKHNALWSKEIEYAIKNVEIEANYKIEVINKALEEDLVKLEEETTRAKHEKTAYDSNMKAAIDAKQRDIETRKRALVADLDKKRQRIDEALEREIREPNRNILKTEAIVDERLSKLDINNAIYVDFIADSMNTYRDDKLTLEQVRDIMLNNDTIYVKTVKYLQRAYDVLRDAVTFMQDIEKQNVLNQIAATSDQSQIKRLNKQLAKIEADHAKQIESIQITQNDHIAVNKALIDTELSNLKRANPDSVEALVQLAETAYHKVFDQINDLQAELRTEVKALYEPLTTTDRELIEHARVNADKAKQLVDNEQRRKFEPLDAELEAFLAKTKQDHDAFIATLDASVSELRAQINHLKNEALDQVRAINGEKDRVINEKSLQKQALEETEDKEIVKRHERIDEQITTLAREFEQQDARLDAKDAEAKKIFDYEDRIHNIAVESATSRFNDANIKAENVHLNNLKQYQRDLEQAKLDRDRRKDDYAQELKARTKDFEKNIFTVRPRLEESIGDAQKQIESQIAEKSEQKHDLLANNAKLVESAETALYSAFQEGYDKLRDNLRSYIDKYRVIEQEYLANNTQANDQITANNVAFSKALFELSKTKHQSTLKQLQDINQTLFGKEA